LLRIPAYVDKVLKGANPSDLPIEVTTRRELIFNLKAADAIGVTISPELLRRADRVIERSALPLRCNLQKHWPGERWPKLGVDEVFAPVGLVDWSSDRWTNARAVLIIRSSAASVTGSTFRIREVRLSEGGRSSRYARFSRFKRPLPT
jgi:hypothetical protein